MSRIVDVRSRLDVDHRETTNDEKSFHFSCAIRPFALHRSRSRLAVWRRLSVVAFLNADQLCDVILGHRFVAIKFNLIICKSILSKNIHTVMCSNN